MWYGLAADTVVALHVAYVGYVVIGQLLIILGAAMKWKWVRNPWFRFTHLLAIGVVAYEAINNIRCPLTVWEEQLRLLGGQEVNVGQTFMGRLLHDILFYDDKPEIFFTTIYIGMLVVVLQGLLMYPPRMFRLWKRPEPAAVEALRSEPAKATEPGTAATRVAVA